MKHIYISCTAILAFLPLGFAQPVIQSIDVNPEVGEEFVKVVGAYVSPGDAGSNVTWNLSGMTGTEVVTTIQAGDPAFPQTNRSYVTAGSGLTYYMENNTSGQYVHGVNAGGSIITYTNPLEQLKFPLAMDNYSSDLLYATFVSSGQNFAREGFSTITVDGYGTLITPSGTYTDVLRIHFTQDYDDSSANMVIDYDVDTYAWYKSGYHQELAMITTNISSNAGTQTTGVYLKEQVLGLSEKEMQHVSIYPNPSSGKAFISNQSALNLTNIAVYNEAGILLGAYDVNVSPQDQTGIDVSSFAHGLLILKLQYENGSVLHTKMIRE